MGLIQDWLRSIREKKAEKKRMENMHRWEERYEEKKLSSDERELMRFREEERQKLIKSALAKHRKKMNNDIWEGKMGNPLYTKNVISHQKEIFKNSPNIFAHKSNLFNQPSMFMADTD